MRRLLIVLTRLLPSSAVTGVLCVAMSLAVKAEDPPIFQSYEIKKDLAQRQSMARDPRAFWIRQVVTRIEGQMPRLEHAPKQSLTSHVSFVVARDGRLVSAEIGASSGDPQFDQRALAMVRGAQPFPAMPPAIGEETLAFSLPVRFR
jgi:TonB family protein